MSRFSFRSESDALLVTFKPIYHHCYCVSTELPSSQRAYSKHNIFSSFYLFTQPKERFFLKPWRTAYPIHKGQCPCISGQNWNITAFLPSVWPAVFVQFFSHFVLCLSPLSPLVRPLLTVHPLGKPTFDLNCEHTERPVELVETLKP